ncbi:MAG TPA: outer membrane beta-barrel protein [Gemmatimonadales bacterium]|nr:outer membrane beta-barrel protein [Gemmatimonadales bacterium]
MRKLITTISGILTTAVVGTAIATPAAAQGGVELTPWAGAYLPTNNSFSTSTDNFKRDVSVIGGARLSFWGTSHLGFEVTGGYAPAKVAGETINETKTNLLVANARLLLALTPVTSGVGVFVGGGGALLTRGKNTFDNDKSSTDLGATLGLGFRFGGGNDVGFRLDIEDYMYNGDFGGGNSFQNDLVTSVGVSIPLGGKAD